MDGLQLSLMWDKILKAAEPEFIKPFFETWIKATIPLSFSGDTLEIGTPKQIIKDWLETRYAPIIDRAVFAVTGRHLEIRYINLDVSGSAAAISEAGEAASNSSSLSAPAPAVPLAPPSPSPPSPTGFPPLNTKYTFETFVIGNSNRFAHAAALAVAEEPARVYNPFFIYGGSGLGKTHLLHAIAHRIRAHAASTRIVYISSETFTNDFINSIRDAKQEHFRNKYRTIDVLLIDDIQFLAKKEQTQEEFFHTFNTLHEANKQIVITSDRPPREIATLEDRLRSRFESGLITDIQPPDLETRIAILRKLIQNEQVAVPNDVIVSIASRIKNNVRELQGALTRVIGYAATHKKPIDLDLVAEALSDIFPDGRPRQITTELIQQCVASYFKVRTEDLSAKKRTRNIAYPRQIAMYLARELTDCSLSKIGELFGGKDHTTVIHAHDKISQAREADPQVNALLQDLIKRIRGG